MNLSATAIRTPATAAPTHTQWTPHDPHEEGWLGQVPPPAPTPPRATEPEPSPYAVPWLEPEPWKSDPPLPGTDPTLFG